MRLARPTIGDSDEARELREEMLRSVASDVSNRHVLDAMRRVPRHLFVPNLGLVHAYFDMPASIGHGQTISQPTIVGLMTQALDVRATDRVLEIGTGSGYQAAVLSVLAKEVYTIEVVKALAEESSERLARLGYANVHVRTGDGYEGWPEAAPFDRILLTAAPDAVPRALFDQLADGGVLVAPVGAEYSTQSLLRYRKESGVLTKEFLTAVQFVPMVREA